MTMNIDSDSRTDVTIKCRLRKYKDEKTHSLRSKSSNGYDDYDADQCQEMICKMHQGEEGTEWNLWEGMTFDSVVSTEGQFVNGNSHGMHRNDPTSGSEGDGADNSSDMVLARGNGQGHTSSKESNADVTKLSFVPVPRLPSRPSRPRPLSRIRASQSSNGDNTSSPKLLNPKYVTPPRDKNRKRSPRRSTLRSESPKNLLAAACFSVGSCSRQSSPSMARVDASDLLRDLSSSSQPFDIPLTDITSVQKEFNLGRNGSVGVIYIQTNCNGFLEVIPHTEDGRDSVVAFLQACLPQGTLKDKLSILELRQLHLSRSDSSLFDMEKFEFHAVKKRFANESIWERMRRRSARFSARIQELCVCCETVEENNDVVYTSLSSNLEKDSDNCTVESVLTEMELLDVGDDSPSIEVVSCKSKEGGDNSAVCYRQEEKSRTSPESRVRAVDV